MVSDPTMTDLQDKVEKLRNCMDSLSKPVTNWGDINATNAFKSLSSTTILQDIKELKHHLKKVTVGAKLLNYTKTLN